MKTPIIFTQAFRPFFPLAALFTAISVMAWIAGLSGAMPLPAQATLWHAHEMLFGFAVAIIAGFALTAAANWTGKQTTKPWELAMLCALWLAARVTAFVPATTELTITAAIDSLFLPGVALIMTRVLLKTGNQRNYMFIPFLWGLSLVNISYHLSLYNGHADVARILLSLTVYLVGFLMVFMGGRVIPFFSKKRCQYTPKQWPWLNWLSTLSSLFAGLTIVALPMSNLAAGMATIAGISSLLRLALWRPWLAWRVPLLWILHIGYGWLAAAYLLAALTHGGWLSPSNLAIHTLMAGGLGCLGLGMITRVSLGHSGRPLETSRIMMMTFVLMVLAGLVRVSNYLPTSWSGITSLTLSAILWSAAFLLYFCVFAPMLWRQQAN